MPIADLEKVNGRIEFHRLPDPASGKEMAPMYQVVLILEEESI
jgi:hypothetical protein